MSKEKLDKSVEKYLAAETSLEEEKSLLDGQAKAPGVVEWAMFARQKREELPANFNEAFLERLQARERGRTRRLISFASIAASILLLLALQFNFGPSKTDGYAEKEALLNEALSMFEEEDSQAQSEKKSIIYEDEMIVIYMSSE